MGQNELFYSEEEYTFVALVFSERGDLARIIYSKVSAIVPTSVSVFKKWTVLLGPPRKATR